MQVASERELIAAIEAMAVISLAGHRSLQHFIHPATQHRLSDLYLHGFWLVLAARTACVLPPAKNSVNTCPVP